MDSLDISQADQQGRVKTAHELARELLQGPDLPCYHFDPSRTNLVKEIETGTDDTLGTPLVELCRGEDKKPRAVLIAGSQDPNAEEDEIADMIDARAALRWIARQAKRGCVRIATTPDGDTVIEVPGAIFAGEDLDEAAGYGIHERGADDESDHE